MELVCCCSVAATPSLSLSPHATLTRTHARSHTHTRPAGEAKATVKREEKLSESMKGEGKSQKEIELAVAALHSKVADEYQRAGACPRQRTVRLPRPPRPPRRRRRPHAHTHAHTTRTISRAALPWHHLLALQVSFIARPPAPFAPFLAPLYSGGGGLELAVLLLRVGNALLTLTHATHTRTRARKQVPRAQ